MLSKEQEVARELAMQLAGNAFWAQRTASVEAPVGEHFWLK